MTSAGLRRCRALTLPGLLLCLLPIPSAAQILTIDSVSGVTLDPVSAELIASDVNIQARSIFKLTESDPEFGPFANVFVCVPDCDSSDLGSAGTDEASGARWSVRDTCDPYFDVQKRETGVQLECTITVSFTSPTITESRAELYISAYDRAANDEAVRRAPLRGRVVRPALRPTSAELIAPTPGVPDNAAFSLSHPGFTPSANIGICIPDCESSEPTRTGTDTRSEAVWSVGDDCPSILIKGVTSSLGECEITVEFDGPAGAESGAELSVELFNGLTLYASLSGRVASSPSVVSFLQPEYSVEEGNRFAIPVERGGDAAAVAEALTVSVTSDDGDGNSALDGVDYRFPEGTELSWGAGESGRRSLVVQALRDETIEDEETFILMLDPGSSPSSAVVLGQFPKTTVRIIDEPPSGELAFARDEWRVAENAGQVTLLVSRSGGSAGAASVSYRLVDGTATAGIDHAIDALTSGTLRWEAGDASDKPIVVNVNYDADGDESTEYFDVELSDASGASLGDPNSARVFIADVDPPPERGFVGFVAATAVVDEDDGVIEVGLARRDGSDEAISVDVVSVDRSAAAGEDFRAVRSTVTWPDGDSETRTVRVPILFDALDETDETFDLLLENPRPGEAVLGEPRRMSVTIRNTVPPNPGELRLTTATTSVSENAGGVELSVERVDGSDGRVGVAFATADGSALAGADYDESAGTLIWEDGESEAKTFTVPVASDLLVESDETFEVRLRVPSEFAGITRLGSPSSTSVTIVNFVPPLVPGTLQWVAATVSVIEDAGEVELSLTRLDGREGRVGVAFATADGTAMSDGDYEARDGVLVWEDDEVGTKTVTVPIVPDSLDEDDETFEVRLSVPDELSDLTELGSPSTVAVTIIDKPPPRRPGTLRLAVASATVVESDGAVSITVERIDGSDGTVSVDYALAGVSATPDEDFTAAAGTLSWTDGDSAPQEIELTVSRDALIEETETFEVRLSDALDEDGAAVPLGTAVAVVSIEDTTTPGRLSFTREGVLVEENDGAVTLAVERLDGNDGELSVGIEVVGATAVAGEDFVASTTRLTWADGDDAPQEISIDIVEDALEEGDETFVVRLIDPRPDGAGRLGLAEAQVRIVDVIVIDDPSVRTEIVSGDGQSGVPGDVSKPLTLRLLESETGLPRAGATIAWRVLPANAAELLDGDTTITDDDGIASNRVRVLARGFVRVIATAQASAEGAAADPGGTSANLLRVDPPPLEVRDDQAVFTFRSGFSVAEGLRRNPSETGRALDSACEALEAASEDEGSLDAAQEDLLATCRALEERLQDGTLAAALDRLTPEELFFFSDSAIETADLQVTNVLSRVNALRDERARTLDVSELNLSIDGQRIPGAVLQAARETLFFGGGGAAADVPERPPSLGVFANGSASFGELDGGERQKSADVRTMGITIGADYRVHANIVVGVGLGITSNETDFTSDGDKATAESVHLSVFGTWYESDDGYLDVVLDFGRNDYEVVRQIGLPGQPLQRARGKTDADAISLTVGAGKDLHARGWDFGPYVRMSITTADVAGYSETATEDAPGFGSVLDVRGYSVRSTRFAIGGQASRAISTSRAVWLPQLRLEGEFENEADKEDLVASFRHDPGQTAFRLQGEDRDTSYLNLGIGTSAVLRGGKSVYVFYESRLQHELVSQSWLKAGLRIEF